MNFASPEDADLIDVDEISRTKNPTVTLAFNPDEDPRDHSLTTAIESAATEIVDLHERLDETESVTQHRETVIESQQETIADLKTQIEAHTETLKETQEQITNQETTLQTIEETLNQLERLEETVESVQAELDRIDHTATEAAERSDTHNESLCVIHAALFDEEYTCPSCEEGTISRKSTISNTAVVCDACQFNKQISIP